MLYLLSYLSGVPGGWEQEANPIWLCDGCQFVGPAWRFVVDIFGPHLEGLGRDFKRCPRRTTHRWGLAAPADSSSEVIVAQGFVFTGGGRRLLTNC